jgi:hypothetical protein
MVTTTAKTMTKIIQLQNTRQRNTALMICCMLVFVLYHNRCTDSLFSAASSCTRTWVNSPLLTGDNIRVHCFFREYEYGESRLLLHLPPSFSMLSNNHSDWHLTPWTNVVSNETLLTPVCPVVVQDDGSRVVFGMARWTKRLVS